MGQSSAPPGHGIASSGLLADRATHDPRTGRPAESQWRTVSVAAQTCVDANVASTASFLLNDAPAWLEARQLPARLVSVDGECTFVAGWPEDQA